MMVDADMLVISGCMLANTAVLIWLLGRMDKLERKYYQLKQLMGIQKVNTKNGA